MSKSVNEAVIDRLSELPEEIILSIISTLTLKEAARTSVVCKRWRHLWRCYPVLNFENSTPMAETDPRTPPITEAKTKFVAHVSHVLEQHQGFAIDQLSVIFDLDDSYKNYIDEWVNFAVEKYVKTIELNLQPPWALNKRLTVWLSGVITFSERVHYTWPSIESHKLASLRSLSLRNVDISSDALQMILQSCSLLEALSVLRSDILISIRVLGFSLTLERLEIGYCPNIEIVDICAPKLRSLKYDGKPIKLHIAKASLLSEVHIGGQARALLAPTYESLSMYFPNLIYLSLEMSLDEQLNLKANQVPVLSRLKHLQLYFHSCRYQTLLGWTSLLEACRVLEKLTIELYPRINHLVDPKPIVKRSSGRPFECLKTLELLGYTGWMHDLELASYVLENAICMKQVIVDLLPRPNMDPYVTLFGLVLLEENIPDGVEFVVKETYPPRSPRPPLEELLTPRFRQRLVINESRCNNVIFSRRMIH